MSNYTVIRSNDHLAHYGVKGMKWRIRQGYDRSGPGWDPGTGVQTVGKKITTGLGTPAAKTKKIKKTKTTKTKTTKTKTKKETAQKGKETVNKLLNKQTETKKAPSTAEKIKESQKQKVKWSKNSKAQKALSSPKKVKGKVQ